MHPEREREQFQYPRLLDGGNQFGVGTVVRPYIIRQSVQLLCSEGKRKSESVRLKESEEEREKESEGSERNREQKRVSERERLRWKLQFWLPLVAASSRDSSHRIKESGSQWRAWHHAPPPPCSTTTCEMKKSMFMFFLSFFPQISLCQKYVEGLSGQCGPSLYLSISLSHSHYS